MKRHIHFVGIGGIGMSGIAELLLNLGYKVSGSDVSTSEITNRLSDLGATIFEGHKESQVSGCDVVVISSAVKSDNPEVVSAKKQNIPVIPRAEMLAELMRMKEGIAIAGTHGKTTTTSIVSTILAYADLDPTIVIGGKLNAIGSNARLGSGKYIVAEADESDKSFLLLSPTIAVVTNIDLEHMDRYKNLDDIKSTFLTFLSRLPFTGLAVLCVDEPNVQSIIPKIEKRKITYGTSPQADLRATNIKFEGLTTSFDCYQGKKHLGQVMIPMPGIHNVRNCLSAIAVAIEVGIDFPLISDALKEFSGVQRRFTLKGERQEVMVFDDYGHHPTEIKATISAARHSYPNKRIIAVFQPHRFTRTRDLFDEFLGSFNQADMLMLTDIYPASESPIAGVSGKSLQEGMIAQGYKNVHFCAKREQIPQALWPHLKKHDIVITLGAGDIVKTGPEILKFIEKNGLSNEQTN
ncbi:UDP-N-acetylmuramate--L-alanine ligase [Bdellovibrionota bacterium]